MFRLPGESTIIVDTSPPGYFGEVRGAGADRCECDETVFVVVVTSTSETGTSGLVGKGGADHCEGNETLSLVSVSSTAEAGV
jgi:hypothetical protein